MPRTVLLLVGLGAMPLQAQRPRDESRLVVGVTIGWIGGEHLWGVNGQPVLDPTTMMTDTLSVGRDFGSQVNWSAQLTYYLTPHLGVTGEFTELGLSTMDSCAPASNPCDVTQTDVHQATGAASMLAGGIVYRLTSRTELQPYVRLLGGIATVAQNPDALAFGYPSQYYQGGQIAVWPDEGWNSQRLAGTIGIGMSTAPSRGFQVHFEVRESWISLARVTGPSNSGVGGVLPPHESVWKGFPSFAIGIDLVLRKKRGLRY